MGLIVQNFIKTIKDWYELPRLWISWYLTELLNPSQLNHCWSEGFAKYHTKDWEPATGIRSRDHLCRRVYYYQQINTQCNCLSIYTSQKSCLYKLYRPHMHTAAASFSSCLLNLSKFHVIEMDKQGSDKVWFLGGMPRSFDVNIVTEAINKSWSLRTCE